MRWSVFFFVLAACGVGYALFVRTSGTPASVPGSVAPREAARPIDPPSIVDHAGSIARTPLPATSESAVAASSGGDGESPDPRHPLQLRVEVFAPAGTGVPGATVTVTQSPNRDFEFFDSAFLGPTREIATGVTDATGAVTLDVPPDVMLGVTVTAKGAAAARSSGVRAGTTHRVYLSAEAEISGRIVDAATKRPIDGARVRLERGGGDFRRAERLAETTSDANGGYRFVALEPGPMLLSAANDRFSMGWPLEVELKLGERAVRDLELEAGERVTGVVVDATTRAPIAGAKVGARPQSACAVTDPLGRFEIESFPRYGYTLSARAPGYATNERPIRDFPSRALATEVEFALQPERRARGIVVDTGRMPITDAYVAAAASDYDGDRGVQRIDWCAAHTDAEGRFEIAGIHPGIHHVLVVRHEGEGTRLYEFPHDAPDVVDFGILELSRGATLCVNVVDEKDAPRPSLEVAVAGSPHDRTRFGPGIEEDAILDSYVAERSGVTDATGTFVFRDLAPGDYVIRAIVPGTHRTLELACPIADFELEKTARFVVPRGLEMRGVVKVTDGRTPPKVYVSIDPEQGQGSSGDAECNADGGFIATGLAPGLYRLTAYPYASDADKREGRTFATAIASGIEAGRVNVEILLESTRVLHGVVVDAEGRGIAALLVSAVKSGGTLAGSVTDSAGAFELRIGESTQVDLVVERDGKEIARQPARSGEANTIQIR